MTISQLRGATIRWSEFSETGNTGATYGHHAPAAGVDIEPDYNTTSTTPAVDVLTGHITFIECKFTNNVGGQFLAAYASNSEKIRLRDCELIAGTSTSAYHVILATNDGVIEDSYIDTGGQFVHASWGDPFVLSQRTTIRNCEIHSANLMLVTDRAATVAITDCRLIGTGTVPHSGAVPIYIQNAKCTFKNNYVFFPRAMYAGSGTYDVIGIVQQVRFARDNVYETDMNPNASQHFAMDYTGAETVQGESYLSAGTNTGFRPEVNAVWDNTFPYSNGYGSIGSSIVTHNLAGASNNRIVMVQSMPTSDSWNKGDIALLVNPAKGRKIGWTRLTSGNENILNTDWQPFGAIDS
ncbi:MAG: hypothetical protein WCF33_05890 [Pseudonocardiaceae bacterium]